MNQIVNLKSIKPSCSECRFSQLCLPCGLNHKEYEQFESVNYMRTLKKGGLLFRRGEPLQSLYAVHVGSVKVYIPSNNGGEQIVGFHMPGELFGFDAIGHGVHSCTARALETCNICVISYEQLDALCHQIPVLGKNFMSLMSQQIVDEHEMMLMLGNKPGESRVAALLLNIASRFHARGFSATQFNLSMMRKDMGNYLGLNVESISRCIRHLQDDNIIAVDGRYIHILNMQKLWQLAGVGEAASPQFANSEYSYK
jgi:CRP/FNR family transcriptional regulator